MSAITDLNQCWIEKRQREDAFAARAALENATNVLQECHQMIQGLVDSGSFDTVPIDLKNTLNDWWSIVKTARTSISINSDIMDVYNWRP